MLKSGAACREIWSVYLLIFLWFFHITTLPWASTWSRPFSCVPRSKLKITSGTLLYKEKINLWTKTRLYPPTTVNLPFCWMGSTLTTLFFKKMGQLRPLFHLFSSLQTHITIFTTKNVKKCSSSILCWDSNSRPLDHESPPITTRPGNLPLWQLFVG